MNCPECRRKLQNQRCKDYNKRNKEKMREYRHKYRQRDYVKIKIYQRKRASKYNITNEQYETITTKCLVCGYTDLVDLHHKDCNHSNNNLNNLIGLCPNHHFLIHRKGKTLEELLNSKQGAWITLLSVMLCLCNALLIVCFVYVVVLDGNMLNYP